MSNNLQHMKIGGLCTIQTALRRSIQECIDIFGNATCTKKKNHWLNNQPANVKIKSSNNNKNIYHFTVQCMAVYWHSDLFLSIHVISICISIDWLTCIHYSSSNRQFTKYFNGLYEQLKTATTKRKQKNRSCIQILKI